MSVNDDPHERYQMVEPVTGKELSHGIPILTDTDKGKVVDKEVTHYMVKCPDCMVEVRYSHSSEPVCPECGLICSGRDSLTEERLVVDARAAGRVEAGNNEE